MRIVTARAYDFAHLLLSSSSSMMSQCSFDRAVFLKPIAVLAILGLVSNKPYLLKNGFGYILKDFIIIMK